jgi:alpha/beta superfamily hydrolase
VPCPTLITLGSKEVESNMAFQGLPRDLQALAASRPSLRTEIIAGADHFYTGQRHALADKVERWLRSLLPG